MARTGCECDTSRWRRSPAQSEKRHRMTNVCVPQVDGGIAEGNGEEIRGDWMPPDEDDLLCEDKKTHALSPLIRRVSAGFLSASFSSPLETQSWKRQRLTLPVSSATASSFSSKGFHWRSVTRTPLKTPSTTPSGSLHGEDSWAILLQRANLDDGDNSKPRQGQRGETIRNHEAVALRWQTIVDVADVGEGRSVFARCRLCVSKFGRHLTDDTRPHGNLLL